MPRVHIPESVAPDLLERLQARFHPWPLIKDWDLSIEAVRPGWAAMRLKPGPRTVNGPRGNVNGGVLATVGDMAMALALSTAFDGAMPFATSDLQIRYLEPAKGETWCEAEVVRVSGRSAVLEARIRCGTHLVALCTAHFAMKANLS